MENKKVWAITGVIILYWLILITSLFIFSSTEDKNVIFGFFLLPGLFISLVAHLFFSYIFIHLKKEYSYNQIIKEIKQGVICTITPWLFFTILYVSRVIATSPHVDRGAFLYLLLSGLGVSIVLGSFFSVFYLYLQNRKSVGILWILFVIVVLGYSIISFFIIILAWIFGGVVDL